MFREAILFCQWNLIRVVFPVALALALPKNHGLLAEDTFPGTEAGLKALMQQFLTPEADVVAISKKLRPTKRDFAVVFKGDFAKKVEAMHEEAWKIETKDDLLPSGLPDQAILVRSITSEDIKQWTKNASDFLPPGYKDLGEHIADNQTFYSVRFVTSRLSGSGIVYVDGHWRFFIKPFRALPK